METAAAGRLCLQSSPCRYVYSYPSLHAMHSGSKSAARAQGGKGLGAPSGRRRRERVARQGGSPLLSVPAHTSRLRV